MPWVPQIIANKEDHRPALQLLHSWHARPACESTRQCDRLSLQSLLCFSLGDGCDTSANDLAHNQHLRAKRHDTTNKCKQNVQLTTVENDVPGTQACIESTSVFQTESVCALQNWRISGEMTVGREAQTLKLPLNSTEMLSS
jgi:hypothetical protein